MQNSSSLIGSVVLTLAISTLAVAQTPQTDTSKVFESALALAKASTSADPNLIAVLEKYRASPMLAPESISEIAPLMSATTTDAETVLKLFPLFSPSRDFEPLASALMVASARQAELEVADPDRVEPVLRAIDIAQSAMSKFAWQGGGHLKLYADVLAVYVDHCPPGGNAARKWEDMKVRHITAARFTLEPAAAIERLEAINPQKLKREKDRAQLEWMKIEQYTRAGRTDDVLAASRALWAMPPNEFRESAWPILVTSLRDSGKKAEAAALLDDVAKQYPGRADEVRQMREHLNDPPASQPAK